MTNDSTKDKILNAARSLFVKHGYAGTSIGKIAKLAGVNHSLIFHHFGNKEKLWLEVKTAIVGDAEKKASIIPPTDKPFKNFLLQSYENLLRFYRENSDIIRMVYWQRLEMGSDEGVKYLRSRGFDDWIAAIEVYQARGEVNSKLASHHISSFIISSISSLGLDHYVIIASKAEQQAYIEFCVDGMLKMFAS